MSTQGACSDSAVGTDVARAVAGNDPNGCNVPGNNGAFTTTRAAYGALSIQTGGGVIAFFSTFSGSASFSDLLTFQEDGFVRFRFVVSYLVTQVHGLIGQVSYDGVVDNHSAATGTPFYVFAGSDDYWTAPIPVAAGVPIVLSESLSTSFFSIDNPIYGDLTLILYGIEFTNDQGQIVVAEFTSESGTDYAAIPEPSALLPLGLALVAGWWRR
jgi:hypothetical protein